MPKEERRKKEPYTSYPTSRPTCYHGVPTSWVLKREADARLLRLYRHLLLDLIDLLARLLLALVQVRSDEVVAIVADLELSAYQRLCALHEAIVTFRLLVLVVPGAEDIVLALSYHRKGKQRDGLHGLLQLGCVLLDDGERGVDFREARVAELVGAGQVRRDVGVWRLEVGMQRGYEALVGAVEEGERLCAIRVRLVEVESVVDDRVGLQMLWLELVL